MAKLMLALVEASLFMLRFSERLRSSGIFLLMKKNQTISSESNQKATHRNIENTSAGKEMMSALENTC